MFDPKTCYPPISYCCPNNCCPLNCYPEYCCPCRCSPIRCWPAIPEDKLEVIDDPVSTCCPPVKNCCSPIYYCPPIRCDPDDKWLCPSVMITFSYPCRWWPCPNPLLWVMLVVPRFMFWKFDSRTLVYLMLVENSSVLIGWAFSYKTTVCSVDLVTIGYSTNSWMIGCLVSSTIYFSCISWMIGICFSWIMVFSDSWIIGTCFSFITYSWTMG